MKRRGRNCKLPFLKQELDNSCLVGCLRMVIASFCVKKQESELREMCHPEEEGWMKPEEIIRCAEKLGFRVQVGRANLEKLSSFLAHKIYPIVFIPPHRVEPRFTVHAVVVSSISEQIIIVHDPFFNDESTGVRPLSIDRFERDLGASGRWAIALKKQGLAEKLWRFIWRLISLICHIFVNLVTQI